MSFKLKVDKSGWEKIKKSIVELDQNQINLGWFDNNRYGPDNSNLPMAYVANLLEQGHINGPDAVFPGAITPPRPFMRVGLKGALNAGSNKLQFKYMIEAVLAGQSTLSVMQKSLPVFEQTLRQVMLDWDSPANSPTTIKLKGFDDPLRNSGELIASVTAKVEKKGSD